MEALFFSSPQSYKTLMKKSFSIYKENFLITLPFAFLTSLFTFLPRILSDFSGENLLPAFNNPFGFYQFVLALINITALVPFLSIIWHMYCNAKKRHEPLSEDIVMGARKVIFVFISAIIVGLFMLSAIYLAYRSQIYILSFLSMPADTLKTFFIFAVLAVEYFILWYFYLIFVFFLPLIVIENKNIISSIIKSMSITWNHWWRLFSLQVTPWICYLGLLFFLKDFIGLNIHIYFVQNPSPQNLFVTFLHLIIFMLFIPWVAALLLLQLKDLELRKILNQKR